jgi:microcystin-dependent protein
MTYDRESLQGLQNFNDEVFFNEKATFYDEVEGNLITSQTLVVSDTSTLGITTATNLTSQTLVVSGTITAPTISGVSSVTDSSGGYISVPAGAIQFFAMNTAPSGWLKANGASLNTTTYATLFSAIAYTFGGSGASFSVPDLRGEFPRGWDDSRGIDSGRSFGTAQSEMINQHKHWISGAAFDDGNMSTSGSQNTQDYGLAADAGSYSVDDPNKPFGRFSRNDPGFGTNNETRPRNIALLACIKY